MRSTTRDDVEAGKIQTQPSDYLADYPVMLTAKHIAEITGLSIGRVRTMFKNQALPAVKLENNRWYVPKQKFMAIFDVQSGKVG